MMHPCESSGAKEDSGLSQSWQQFRQPPWTISLRTQLETGHCFGKQPFSLHGVRGVRSNLRIFQQHAAKILPLYKACTFDCIIPCTRKTKP